jgi:hypothetical protein
MASDVARDLAAEQTELEARAKAHLEFFRQLHLSDAATIEEMEELSRQVDEHLTRVKLMFKQIDDRSKG